MLFLSLIFLTSIVLTIQFYVAREGYYVKSFGIAFLYTVMAAYFSGNKLLFLVLLYVVIALWIMTLIAFFKRTIFNKRFVKKYEKMGIWENKRY